MVRKRGLPVVGEFVICKIDRINPNSAFAVLEEYDKEGMIHISQITSGWVRNIKNHIKVGQVVIAKVVRIQEEMGYINLSLKAVSPKQEKEKIKEYKLNQKAEKMLELAAERLEKSLDQAYEEVGFLLEENFGSLYDGFIKALNNPDLLKERDIKESWIVVLKDVAEKNIEQKEFLFRAKLFIKTYKPNGINIIKGILKKAEKKGLEVKYISAPEYLVKYKTKEAKKGEKDFLDKMEKISKEEGVEFKVIK